MKNEKMKPHGRGQMVFTKKKHLELKGKGYTHTKPKTKVKK